MKPDEIDQWTHSIKTYQDLDPESSTEIPTTENFGEPFTLFCCVLVQACAIGLHLEWCSMFLLSSMPIDINGLALLPFFPS